MANHYRELIAWQKAMDLVEAVYLITSKFPPSEQFGLTNQLRRAVVSIPSNIAEGQGRRLPKQFALFLRTARGSIQEVETQLLIASRLNYVTNDKLAPIFRSCDEVSRVLSGLMRSVEVE